MRTQALIFATLFALACEERKPGEPIPGKAECPTFESRAAQASTFHFNGWEDLALRWLDIQHAQAPQAPLPQLPADVSSLRESICLFVDPKDGAFLSQEAVGLVRGCAGKGPWLVKLPSRGTTRLAVIAPAPGRGGFVGFYPVLDQSYLSSRYFLSVRDGLIEARGEYAVYRDKECLMDFGDCNHTVEGPFVEHQEIRLLSIEPPGDLGGGIVHHAQHRGPSAPRLSLDGTRLTVTTPGCSTMTRELRAATPERGPERRAP